MHDPDFSDLRILVTGGNSGIGRHTAQRLVSRGSQVAVLDLQNDRLVDGAIGYTVDVTDEASVRKGVTAAAQALGGVDGLINNAGIACVGAVDETSDKDWDAVLGVNVRGVARVTAMCLPWLKASPDASVVNVSSVAALNGLPQRVAYSATKGAVLSMTYAMAADHVADGIRFNAVAPATVSTEFVERLLQGFADPDTERAALNARQPIGRMITPDEVAGAICYLVGRSSRSTTGSLLEVDGGLSHLKTRPPGIRK